MSKTEIIVAALNAMDAGDDSQWNGDGSAKVDVLNTLAEGDEKYTRADIDESYPGFNRQALIDNMEDEADEADDDGLGGDGDPDEFAIDPTETTTEVKEVIAPSFTDEELAYMGDILDSEEECDEDHVAVIVNSMNKAKDAAGTYLAGKLISRLERVSTLAQEAADAAAGAMQDANKRVQDLRNELHTDGTPSLAECNAQMSKRLQIERASTEGKQFPIDKSFAPRRGRGRADYNPGAKKA